MTVIYFADGIEVAPPANPYQDFDRQGGWTPRRRAGVAAGPLNPLIAPPR